MPIEREPSQRQILRHVPGLSHRPVKPLVSIGRNCAEPSLQLPAVALLLQPNTQICGTPGRSVCRTCMASLTMSELAPHFPDWLIGCVACDCSVRSGLSPFQKVVVCSSRSRNLLLHRTIHTASENRNDTRSTSRSGRSSLGSDFSLSTG